MRIHVSVQRNHLFCITNTQKTVAKVKNLRTEEKLTFVYLCTCVLGQWNHSLMEVCELAPNELFFIIRPSSLQRVSRGRRMVPYHTCVGESRYHRIPYFGAEKKVVGKAILWHRGINTKMDSTVMRYDQQQKVGARTKKKCSAREDSYTCARGIIKVGSGGGSTLKQRKKSK